MKNGYIWYTFYIFLYFLELDAKGIHFLYFLELDENVSIFYIFKN